MAKALLVLLAAIVLGSVLAIWFGLFNVAATEQHSPLTLRIISLIRDRSIAVRTGDHSPPPLTDPERIKKGFRSYQAMCAPCHSAPGQKATAIREGLNPKPPKLDAAHVQKRSDAELYWIVSHGLRMTGMPAFGPTHEEPTLWAIVAFVRYLPRMTPAEYDSWLKSTNLDEPRSKHVH